MARKRIGGMGTEDFVGGSSAASEFLVEEYRSPADDGKAIDVGLDPGGRPYRDATPERPADPRFGEGSADAWGRIVRSIYRIDVEAAFKRLERPRFSRQPSAMEYGEMIDALDECSELIELASRLHENAKRAHKLYEHDVTVLRAPMRRRAREEAAAEKGKGVVAQADLDAKVAELWPDEYRRQEQNLVCAKGVASHASELLDRWKSRAREIDGVVRTMRKG